MNDILVTKPFQHVVWNDVLSLHVAQNSELDFAKLRAHPRRFNQYLAQLSLYSPENHPDYFPHAEDILAYWINAYNALSLRVALNHYPRSPEEHSGNEDTQPLPYLLGKRAFSLAQLRERVMERAAFYPGLIFALTDYTRDAPPILPEAYTGLQLTQQLQWISRLSLNDQNVVRFVQTHDNCFIIEMSAYWVGKSTVSRHYGDDEDNFELDEEKSEFHHDTAAKPKSRSKTQPVNKLPEAWAGDSVHWATRLQPFAPTGYHADWTATCPPNVMFRKPSNQLREHRVLPPAKKDDDIPREVK